VCVLFDIFKLICVLGTVHNYIVLVCMFNFHVPHISIPTIEQVLLFFLARNLYPSPQPLLDTSMQHNQFHSDNKYNNLLLDKSPSPLSVHSSPIPSPSPPSKHSSPIPFPSPDFQLENQSITSLSELLSPSEFHQFFVNMSTESSLAFTGAVSTGGQHSHKPLPRRKTPSPSPTITIKTKYSEMTEEQKMTELEEQMKTIEIEKEEKRKAQEELESLRKEMSLSKQLAALAQQDQLKQQQQQQQQYTAPLFQNTFGQQSTYVAGSSILPQQYYQTFKPPQQLAGAYDSSISASPLPKYTQQVTKNVTDSFQAAAMQQQQYAAVQQQQAAAAAALLAQTSQAQVSQTAAAIQFQQQPPPQPVQVQPQMIRFDSLAAINVQLPFLVPNDLANDISEESNLSLISIANLKTATRVPFTKLPSTSPGDFIKWRETVRTESLINGQNPFMFATLMDSWALVTRNLPPNATQEEKQNVYFGAHQAAFGMLRAAVAEKIGSQIFISLKNEQALNPYMFIDHNARLLWVRISNHLQRQTSFTVGNLYSKLNDFYIKANASPKDVLEMYNNLIYQIETLETNPISPSLKKTTFLNAVAKLYPELRVQFAINPEFTFEQVFEAYERLHDIKGGAKGKSEQTLYTNDHTDDEKHSTFSSSNANKNNNYRNNNNNRTFKSSSNYVRTKSKLEREDDGEVLNGEEVSFMLVDEELPDDDIQSEISSDDFDSDLSYEESDIEENDLAGLATNADAYVNETSTDGLSSVKFILDSGAARHITNDFDLLYNVEETAGHQILTGAFSASTRYNKVGSIKLSASYVLREVAYVKSATANLISASRIIDAGYYIVFNKTTANVMKTGSKVVEVTFKRDGPLWVLSRPLHRIKRPAFGKIKPKGRHIPKKGEAPSAPSAPSVSPAPASVSTSMREQLQRAREAKKKKQEERNRRRPAAAPAASASLAIESNYSNYVLMVSNPKINQCELWHQRFGHKNDKILKAADLQYKLGIPGKQLKNMDHSQCMPCIQSRGRRSNIDKGEKVTEINVPLHTIVADTIGPISFVMESGDKERVYSLGNALYVTFLTDRASHYIIPIFTTTKNQIPLRIVEELIKIQHLSNRPIKKFHSDGGTEFINKTLEDYLKMVGIQRTISVAGEPRLNGLAERTNREIITDTIALIKQCNGPKELWAEACNHAVLVRNILPKPSLNYNVPHNIIFGSAYPIDKIKVFGCDALVSLSEDSRGKFQDRFVSAIFVGVSREYGSYKLVDPQTGSAYSSRHVKFNEQSFTQCAVLQQILHPTPSPIPQPTVIYEDITDESHIIQPITIQPQAVEYEHPSSPTFEHFVPQPPSPTTEEEEVEEPFIEKKVAETIAPSIPSIPVTPTAPTASPLTKVLEELYEHPLQVTRVGRKVRPPPRYGVIDPKDLDTMSREQLKQLVSPQQKPPTIRKQPTTRNVRTSKRNLALLTTTIDEDIQNDLSLPDIKIDEPSTFKQAMKSTNAKQWKAAMDDEIKSLKDLNVYKVVKCPPNMKPISSRWVNKIKLDANNKPVRFKSRIVARGFTQEYGINYNETFSPVAKFKSIKLLLSLAASQNLEIKQLDVKTAFLNANLDEEIYMQPPPGYEEKDKSLVWKLEKALYGLKQSPYCWNKEVDTYMKQLGYQPIQSDVCIYVKPGKTNKIIIGLYVDDCVIIYDKLDEPIWLHDKQLLSTKYEINDLGDCKFILNMQVIRERPKHKIYLSQSNYIEKALKELNFTDSKEVLNPATADMLDQPVDKTDLKPLDSSQHHLYRSIVGMILWTAITTRIDVAYACSILTHHLATPYAHHLTAARKVLRYLATTKNYCLVFGNKLLTSPQDTTIDAYADASWGNSTNRKSTSGVIIKINNDLCFWSSKRQPVVALSTCEAEYISIAESIKEALWFQTWLNEVYNIKPIINVFNDNLSSIQITKNDTNHGRTKHIDIRYHFIRDHISKGNVKAQWIDNTNQIADLLTKTVKNQSFTTNVSKLLLNKTNTQSTN
jgi:hypothetical protein